MDNGLLWASAVSLVGLGTMGLVAIVIEPPHVSLEELPRRLGATVTVEADLVNLDSRPDGWSRMRLQDDNRSIDAILAAPLNLSTGDRVRATGQVGTYGGRIQLQVESSSDVVLVRAWREDHVPLSRLLSEPWPRLGTHVRTSGLVEGRFLADAGGGFGLPLRGPIGSDGPSWVEGLFSYAPARGQFQIEVQRMQPLDGPA